MCATNRLRARAEWRPEWTVLLISTLACAFVFSGRLQSADEIAVYALTHSLAQRGALDINILASTAPGMSAPPFTGIGWFGPDANFYSGKGILPSLLAIPLFKIGLWMDADPVVMALLLNIVLTALTTFVIARYVRLRFGNDRAAFWLGTLYVIGTMTLAYSKRLFTEPAAALCIALTFVWLVPSRSAKYDLGAGLAFGGAIAASYSNAVLLPCYVAWVLMRHRGSLRDAWPRLALFAAGITPWLIGLSIYNLIRFGNVTETGLSFLEWSLPYFTPQAAFVRAYALLFSPYRGFIFYNPILLLALIALMAGWLRNRRPFDAWASDATGVGRAALFIAATGTAAYVLFFSLWSMWWGGFNWGPRFLLPIVPIWMTALAPVFAQRQGRMARQRVARWAVVALSIAVAWIGGLADIFRSEGELAQKGMLNALVTPNALSASSLLSDVQAFQAVTGADQLARGELDVWWRNSMTFDNDLAHALDDVTERATPSSAVLLMTPSRIEPFLHAYRLPNELMSLSPDQIKPDDDAPARQLLNDAARVFMITDAAQGDVGNTTERWLEANAFRARNEFYGSWRVAGFGAPVSPTTVITPAAQFREEVTLSAIEYSSFVTPGGAVTIRATWQRGEHATTGIAWFAHLIAPDESLVAQHDALIGSGYPWRSPTLIDHRGIFVPADSKPGMYRVRIGVYTGDGARLKARRGGASLPEDMVTFNVEVK